MLSKPGMASKLGWTRVIGRMLVCAVAGIPVAAMAQSGAGGKEVNAFDVTPRVGVSYDSNVFQLNSTRFSGDTSDEIFTPAVDASLTRTIGRNRLSLNGDVGYTLHQHYSSLDQLVITASGNGTAALTAYCLASPSLSVSKQQNNLSGVSAIKNSQTFQDYDVTLACQRPAGFYPSVTVGYQAVTNSQEQLSLFNQHTLRVNGGVGYALSSVGSLLLSAGETRIRQPNGNQIENNQNGSNVFNIGLTFNRAVAPRLSFSLSARYLSVDPLRASTQAFSGLGYSESVNYHPSPRLSLVAAANRDVTGSGDVSVSYVLASVYSLTANYVLSPHTKISASALYSDNDYRGENPIFVPVLRGKERIAGLNGSVTRTVGQRLQVSGFLNYSSGNANGDFYDYTRFVGGASMGFRL